MFSSTLDAVCVTDDMSFFFFFKQKTAYEMRISDWSSDVCSSDLHDARTQAVRARRKFPARGALPPPHPRRAGRRPADLRFPAQIGRAPCRESVCQYV